MDQENKMETKPKTINRWIAHCRVVAKDNPDLAYKEVLRKARDSYTKVEKPAKEKVARKPKKPSTKSENDSE